MRISARGVGKVGGVVPLVLLAVLYAAGPSAAADLVIRRGLVGSVGTLDPQVAATFEESTILTDLFEGLVAIDALGRPVPGAAESWTLSPDGRVYTFKLRKDGRWSNGQAVKAADFVAAFRRLFDPATVATEDGPLQVIKGAVLVKQGLAKPETLGVVAIDPLTLEITLEQPTPTFLLRLTQPAAFPVNLAAIKKFGSDFGTTGKIVSNGPYRVGAIDKQDGYILLKNDGFRAAGDIAADSIVYRPFADAADCVTAFRAKEVLTCSDVPTEALGELKTEFGPALEIAPYEGTYFYAFDTAKKPFDDPRIRRALSLAIDRDALARDAWSGGMVPAWSLVPRDLSSLPAVASEPMDKRRDEARALLRAAGFGDGKNESPLEVEIRVGTGASHEQTARLVSADWKAIGVQTKIVTETNGDHFARLRDGGDFDIARAGWILEEADAADILSLLRGDKDRFNFARYDNRGYNEILDRANVALDPAERQRRLAEAETVIERDQPVISLLGYATLTLVSPTLKGWEPNVINRHPSRFLRVDAP